MTPESSARSSNLPASRLEPQVSFESGPYLFQALGRKAAKVLKKALDGESPDLFAERFAVPCEPTLSRRDEHLERKDSLHLG